MDKAPKIHREAMTGGKYYGSKTVYMSRGSMNIEAWDSKIMGLEDGLRARANTKRGDSSNPPRKGATPRRTVAQSATRRTTLLKRKHPTRWRTKQASEGYK